MSAAPLTYAGIDQATIVANLQDVAAFINQLPVEIPVLKKATAQMMLPDGYIARIAAASTAAELKDTVNNLLSDTPLEVSSYAGRAFSHVLQTYAALRIADKTDPLCQQAYDLLTSWRAWGGMPSSGFSVLTSEDNDAEVVFNFKKDKIAATGGMLAVMPAYCPQLQWQYYVHPTKGVTRDTLAEAIVKSYKKIFNDAASPLSSEVPDAPHTREGGHISRITGSENVINAVKADLTSAGLVTEDSFEQIATPADAQRKQHNNGFSQSFIGSFSSLRR